VKSKRGIDESGSGYSDVDFRKKPYGFAPVSVSSGTMNTYKKTCHYGV